MMFAAATVENMFAGLRGPFMAGLIAVAVSYFLTPFVRKLAINQGVVDDPTRDDRRVHTEPIPRWGGIAIYAAIVIAVLTTFLVRQEPMKPYVWGILLVSGVLVLVGALDDLHQYKAKIQLVVLLLAGTAVQFFTDHTKYAQVQILGFQVPFAGGYIEFGLWGILLTTIYLFVVTKTMDTLDGIDGLTAGVSTIAAVTLTLIAVYAGQPRVAILTAAVGGASFGFLRHNYNPAKIFMGTGGAYVLGFSLACLSVVGTLKTAAAAAIFMPMLIFGLPIADAVMVVVRRIKNKVPITTADKRHMHHELLARGLSQRQTVWVLYAATALLCVVGLLLARIYG
jgi:UDP-GlcNAc:undecaprenyl-phosphate/decaprenyl-phosphate GlcNAc-1-phosphate transferase